MKKPGGENNENKIRKVELVSKTSTRKKIWAYSKPSRKQSWQKVEYTLENYHRKKIKTYSEPSEKRPNEHKATHAR